MRVASTRASAIFVLIAILPLYCSRGATAADQDFYRGKTLTIVVGSTSGGAYDAYGRLLARYLVRHLPGSPLAVVQDLPGAGSLTAVRYLTANAPTDGTVIATFNPGLIMQSIVSPDTVKFNFANLYWLGGITHEFRACFAWYTTGLKSWKDIILSDRFVMGAASIGTGAYINGAVMRNIFGIKVRQIEGYPGSAEQRLAVERGELDGGCSEWNALPEDWIRKNEIYPLVRWLKEVPDGFPRDVPYIVDLATSPDDKTILTTLATPSELGNPFAISRLVPRDRRQMLRAAFEETMTDRDFLADAAAQKMPVQPTSGAAAEFLVDNIYKAATPDLIEKTKNAMK